METTHVAPVLDKGLVKKQWIRTREADTKIRIIAQQVDLSIFLNKNNGLIPLNRNFLNIWHASFPASH